MGPEDFERWYGGWDPLDPSTIASFMEGFERPWWIIGGWALERFTGVPRQHEDMDISILARDAEAFRHFLGDQWTPWNMDDGWLRPYDGRFGAIRADSQIWVRAHARARWVLDVPLTPDTDGLWTNKRLRDESAPLEDVTWVTDDGLRHLNPEIILLMKAAQIRVKDQIDAEVALPLLDAGQRAWLRGALERHRPDHPWLGRL